MGLGHRDPWSLPPVRLDYQSRLRHRPPPPVRRAVDPRAAVVLVTAATATTLVVGCLTVAVPCLVFAGVGLWFDDASTLDAAWTAGSCLTAAAVAAVPAVVCHRRLARRSLRGWAAWN